MGLSYLMAAHPTWDSVLQVLSLYGLAVAFGPGAFALIQAASNKTEETTGEAPENSLTSLLTLVGSAAGLVLTLAFIAAMSFGSTQLVSVGNYFDPNHPTTGMLTSDLYSPFATGTVGITIASIVCAVVALAFAVYGRKSGKWLVAGAGIAVFALAAGVLLRAVFFATGGSVFMFY
jgi:anaerobic dimethyl sulfoxide reductase subunit C (anchor subunit)